MNPNVVVMLTPKWSEYIMVDPRTEPLCCVRPDPGGGHSATLKIGPHVFGFPARVGKSDGEDEDIKAWGLERIGPGVWAVQPSLHVVGTIHAFVVLCDVPEPAPFA